MAGPYDHYIGELWPGAYGWLPLDENGMPIAPARIDPPNPDKGHFACHVMANPKIPLEGEDALTTPTGAPITDQMTSNVDKRDGLADTYKSAPKPAGWDSDQRKISGILERGDGDDPDWDTSDSQENTIRHRSDK
jgi:hypothetical protein